jgi:hypothetical protein
VNAPQEIKRAIMDGGNRAMRGWRRIWRGGSKASVMKKFQCTPYSVTCSLKRMHPD